MRFRTTFAIPVAIASALVCVLTACSGGGSDDSADNENSASSSATPSATVEPAPKPRRPKVEACYNLTYQQAVAVTTEKKSLPCGKPHTASTFAVDLLDVVVDGHLLAVDSERAQRQVSSTCTERFATWVGGSEEDRRLSLLAPVWFSPTLEQSDAGELWFRCDVVFVGADQELDPLTGSTKGALGTQEGRDRYGLCGTTSPDNQDFARVACSRENAWRAISTVNLEGEKFPGKGASSSVEGPCQDAARDVADDALDYDWGFELPTKSQWKRGQRYAVCWAPN